MTKNSRNRLPSVPLFPSLSLAAGVFIVQGFLTYMLYGCFLTNGVYEGRRDAAPASVTKRKRMADMLDGCVPYPRRPFFSAKGLAER